MQVRFLFAASSVLVACAPPSAPRSPPAAAATTAGTTPAVACSEPERRGLDFWIGDWDLVVESLTNPSTQEWSKARGVSVVRPVLGGCAIEESFHADGPRAPWAGRSFSTYVPGAKAWRQTWVDDSGGYLPFEGGPEGATFALYGEPVVAGGKRVRMRMVFREITRDAIVWTWERGTDPATEWAAVMTIRYSRHPAAAPATACEADPTFHDLDFWLGKWRVTSSGKELGTNVIEKTLGGCAIVEQWKDADGSEGRSLFFHPPSSSTWKQIWLTAAATSPGGSKEKVFLGRGADGSMRFQGELPLPSGKVLLDRTTLIPLEGRRVHQVIEISRDIGAHWETTFDGTYDRL